MRRHCTLCQREIEEQNYDDSWCKRCRKMYDWNVMMLRKEGKPLTAQVANCLKTGRWLYKMPRFDFYERHPCMTKW